MFPNKKQETKPEPKKSNGAGPRFNYMPVEDGPQEGGQQEAAEQRITPVTQSEKVADQSKGFATFETFLIKAVSAVKDLHELIRIITLFESTGNIFPGTPEVYSEKASVFFYGVYVKDYVIFMHEIDADDPSSFLKWLAWKNQDPEVDKQFKDKIIRMLHAYLKTLRTVQELDIAFDLINHSGKNDLPNVDVDEEKRNGFTGQPWTVIAYQYHIMVAEKDKKVCFGVIPQSAKAKDVDYWYNLLLSAEEILTRRIMSMKTLKEFLKLFKTPLVSYKKYFHKNSSDDQKIIDYHSKALQMLNTFYPKEPLKEKAPITITGNTDQNSAGDKNNQATDKLEGLSSKDSTSQENQDLEKIWQQELDNTANQASGEQDKIKESEDNIKVTEQSDILPQEHGGFMD